MTPTDGAGPDTGWLPWRVVHVYRRAEAARLRVPIHTVEWSAPTLLAWCARQSDRQLSRHRNIGPVTITRIRALAPYDPDVPALDAVEEHLARALVRRHQRTERLCSSGDHDDEARELVAMMREAGWAR